MRSIELTFDEETDAAIRADWARLADSGIPSLAVHTSPSNMPHVTVAAAPGLEITDALIATSAALPLGIEFGGIVLFGAAAGRHVLARQIVVTRQLLDWHRAVHATIGGAAEHTMPDRWTPHVTISRRPDAEQVAAAIGLLPELPPGRCTQLRFWNPDDETITALGPRIDS